ncbi:hypothetical protein ACOME3_005864 [Neoechinorhynchus agilis]
MSTISSVSHGLDANVVTEHVFEIIAEFASKRVEVLIEKLKFIQDACCLMSRKCIDLFRSIAQQTNEDKAGEIESLDVALLELKSSVQSLEKTVGRLRNRIVATEAALKKVEAKKV